MCSGGTEFYHSMLPVGRNHAEYFNIDLSAAVENLLLEADAQGPGAVWMGIHRMQDVWRRSEKVLGIPSGLNPFALVPCIIRRRSDHQKTAMRKTEYIMYMIIWISTYYE